MRQHELLIPSVFSLEWESSLQWVTDCKASTLDCVYVGRRVCVYVCVCFEVPWF